MADLFEQVLHHLEGNETEIQNYEGKDGQKSYAVPSFGPDRWIERAALGRLMAVDLLAVILFSVRDTFDLKQERRIVDGWAVELKKAVSNGEIQARDPFTLLAMEIIPDGWDWLLSTGDADKFVSAHGMGWKYSEQVEYLLEQSRQEGTKYLDPKTGQILKHSWFAGYEPQLNPAQTDTTPEQAAPPVAVDDCDYSMLATPDKLLDAFERWGLKAVWFKDLNSRKWLLDARRQKGQGQRGHVVKPLFCPFQVMRGMISNVRKRSRMSEDAAWRTLEHKFPNVYAANQQFDKRKPTGD